MTVGCYFKDGTCLVLPLDQMSQKLGISDSTIRRILDGKSTAPKNVAVLVWLPKSYSHRGDRQ